MHVRAAGVLPKGPSILLVKHRKEGKDYWLLPGGRIAAGEYAAQALEREFFEELRIKVKVMELLFVVETLSSFEHIIQLTYLVETESPESICLGKDRRVVDFGFFGHADIRKLIIYPDIGDELSQFLVAGEVKHRYLYKKWID